MTNHITATQRDRIISAASSIGIRIGTETLNAVGSINDTDEDEAREPSTFYTLDAETAEDARILRALIIAAGVDFRPEQLDDLTDEADYNEMVEYGSTAPYFYNGDAEEDMTKSAGTCYALRISPAETVQPRYN